MTNATPEIRGITAKKAPLVCPRFVTRGGFLSGQMWSKFSAGGGNFLRFCTSKPFGNGCFRLKKYKNKHGKSKKFSPPAVGI